MTHSRSSSISAPPCDPPAEIFASTGVAPPEWDGVDPELSGLIGSWRQLGSKLVLEHWREFHSLVTAVERLIELGQYSKAAAAAQIAANYAVFWHTGTFSSRSLERALARIGSAALPFSKPRRAASSPRRVLHVATQVGQIGGHVRMIWRWIGRDQDSVHSVALTRQTQRVPDRLRAAVARSGGTIHRSNRSVGGLLQWARALQADMVDADIVVLHVHNQDVIPFLALAGMGERPFVVLHNHADHVFWLGSTSSDLVVSSRRSGHRLCIDRRGIAPERNAFLPLCLEPAIRTQERSEAKRSLGLAEDSIVLLSIARGLKFRTLGRGSFADGLVPLLRDDPRVHLIAVGPGDSVDWSAAHASVPGRIRVLPETAETDVFLDAADIYVDSFPFASITSLFEAGLRGIPLFTRYPFGSGCEVIGADSLGLDDVLVRVHTAQQLREAIGGLIADPDRRFEIGAHTCRSIEKTNAGPAWDRALVELYDHVDRSLPRAKDTPLDEGPGLEPIDLALPFACGPQPKEPTSRARLALASEAGLKTLLPLERARTFVSLSLNRQFTFRRPSNAWRYLVPEWTTARLVQPLERAGK